MTALLVFGRNGQVAQELSALSPEGSIFLGRDTFDLAEKDPALAIAHYRPAAVINAAGYTAVDKAESEPGLAMRLNAEAAGEMARACRANTIPFIHISTDYVFAGDKMGAYAEGDDVAPATVYGRSKAAGEDAVTDAGGAVAILRTSWVFSGHGSNFLKTMLRLAQSRDEIGVVSDQIGRPTWARDVARAALLAARTISIEPIGILHAAGDEVASWAGFAERIFQQAAARGVPHAAVRHITTADYPTPARRPANSELSIDAIARRLDWRPTPLDEAIAACLDQLVAET